ncbi:unnamed protein product [Porites lobata]|uniref:SCAN box domain-containing protein n=1 Tax=Porites lobata TaxID=104759 RepID=A0ABN8RSZ5_9CNID|nr:unnamed protein product [Porites lobata]
MEKLLQIGKEFGLEGEKLLEFVQKQQKLEEEKEEKPELLKQKEAIEAAKREHELELARLGQGRNDTEADVREDRAKAPKLPSFVDGKDDLDAYLQRFERFATTAKWEKTGWASKLSALLSGRALEVYSRLSEEAAQDYDRVKLALMKRYDLTEDGYCRKFRASKPEVDESPEQFKLAIHLHERAPETLVQIAKVADQYLEAHGKHLFSSTSKKLQVQPKVDETKNQQNDSTTVVCFKCNACGHKAL